MSRRYWLPAIALGLILGGPALGQPRDQQIKQQAAPSKAQGQQAVKPPPVVQVVPSPISGQPKAESPQPKEQDQPDYKWRGETEAQWIMAVAAVAGAGLAFWTLILVQKTLGATREAAGYARRAAEATEATIEEARVSAAAAQKGADAATLSANAAIGVEAPWLVLQNVVVPNSNRPRDWAMKQEIIVNFANRGRTDAIVVRNSLNWIVSDGLNEDPRYPLHSIKTVPSTMTVEPMKWFKFRRDFSLTEEEIADIYAGRRHFWLWGYVETRDFLSIDTRTGFSRVLEIAQENHAGVIMEVGRFTYGGPAAYNYSQRIT